MENNTIIRVEDKDKEKEMFHVIHKVPSGDGPYVRAKQAQAINAGDRVDSALKDMAVVMKQLDRTEEAIQAIKSFRVRCSKQAQQSLDNLLIDLYKKCGMIDEQIELLKQKLRMIYHGQAFNGKLTRTARSHGKKFQVSIQQETSRILGNLGWAYMQKKNYIAAETVYRKAQMFDPDANKACNLALCLMKQARKDESRLVLEEVVHGRLPGSDDTKSRTRAQEMLQELDESHVLSSHVGLKFDMDLFDGLGPLDRGWAPLRPRRLPVFEEISSFKDQLAC
ncbi:hypothetical protein V2J09_005118 [Rumex salicifolius]